MDRFTPWCLGVDHSVHMLAINRNTQWWLGGLHTSCWDWWWVVRSSGLLARQIEFVWFTPTTPVSRFTSRDLPRQPSEACLGLFSLTRTLHWRWRRNPSGWRNRVIIVGTTHSKFYGGDEHEWPGWWMDPQYLLESADTAGHLLHLLDILLWDGLLE